MPGRSDAATTVARHAAVVKAAEGKTLDPPTIRAIAKRSGYTDVTIRSILSNAGIEVPNMSPGREHQFTVLALWLGGMSQADVAKHQGVSSQAVSKVIRRARTTGLLKAIRECDQSRAR